MRETPLFLPSSALAYVIGGEDAVGGARRVGDAAHDDVLGDLVQVAAVQRHVMRLGGSRKELVRKSKGEESKKEQESKGQEQKEGRAGRARESKREGRATESKGENSKALTPMKEVISPL